MDFRAELKRLLRQIPPNRYSRVSDVARALGDARASLAVFRYVRAHTDLPGAARVIAERSSHRRAADRAQAPRFFAAFRGGGALARLREEQTALAATVSRRNGFRTIRTVGGVDVSYSDSRGFASLVVLRSRDLAVVEEARVAMRVDFPYIPTYLAYREFPLIEAAFLRLRDAPDILLVDGHGQLHPVRCGIACMVGVKLGVPTIGVAKSPLIGTMSRRPEIGEAVPVRLNGGILGYALRTGASLKPLFVSTGHRVSPRTAVRIVRDVCLTRNPEPLRLADLHARKWKENKEKGSKKRS
ncbi:MAG: endonuclease V [Candidatus Thermoplasmatota archaeon]